MDSKMSEFSLFRHYYENRIIFMLTLRTTGHESFPRRPAAADGMVFYFAGKNKYGQI